MPETALVTIEYNGDRQDYSLPLQQPISEWKETLIKAQAPGESWEKMLLARGGSVFSDACTLADYSVWDGAVLQLYREV